MLQNTCKLIKFTYNNKNFNAGDESSGARNANCSPVYWKIPKKIRETAGRDVLVAVLDTGINPHHSIFQTSQTTKKIACIKNFVPANEDIDPNILHGFDQHPQCHGTAVASIVAGKNSSLPSKYIEKFDLKSDFTIGVAPKASLVICRVSACNVDPGCVNQALQWIVDHNNIVLQTREKRETLEDLKARHEGCDLEHENKKDKISIINMSFQMEKENIDMEELIVKLKRQKVVCVAGGGNDADNYDPGYPARYSNVLAVGAANMNGLECGFSTYSESAINVHALGENVLVAKTSTEYKPKEPEQQREDPSAVSLGPSPPGLPPPPPPPPGLPPPPPPPPGPSVSQHNPCNEQHSEYAIEKGTSFATPAVCGLIAIILQHARDIENSKIPGTNTQPEFSHFVTHISLLKELCKKYLCNDQAKLKTLLQPQKVENFLEDQIKDIDTLVKNLITELKLS